MSLKGYYFISRGSKGSPSGKLYYKYKNFRRKRGKFDSSLSGQDETESISEHLDVEEEIDESVATAFKSSLNRDSSDWADVCEKWKRTFKIRRRDLQKLSNIDFLQSWPKLGHAKASDLKETPSDVLLHLAALRGDDITLRRVLDSGKVHVDCKDEDGTTPLILSAASGHTTCVLELLEQGADPNSRRATGTTPLFFAAQGGYLDVVKILIKAGASVDTPSVDGGTPLFVAAQGGHVKLVKELLDCGANVNACMKDRATPVFIAAQNGHRTVLSLLITAGAYPDTKRIDGATPLWIAAQMGHDHICKVLLQNGANVDAVRCDGATPLFKAAHKGHAAVVTELLKHRPNLTLLPNGETALHAAAMFGHMTVVKQLIAAGADINQTNHDGLTALQVARQQKYTSICEYLQERQRTNKNRMQQQQS